VCCSQLALLNLVALGLGLPVCLCIDSIAFLVILVNFFLWVIVFISSIIIVIIFIISYYYYLYYFLWVPVC